MVRGRAGGVHDLDRGRPGGGLHRADVGTRTGYEPRFSAQIPRPRPQTSRSQRYTRADPGPAIKVRPGLRARSA